MFSLVAHTGAEPLKSAEVLPLDKLKGSGRGEYSAPRPEGGGLRSAVGPSRPGFPPQPLLPEVLRRQHLIVVEEFALGARAVQGRQDVLHARETAGHVARGAVHLPLEQVDARPPGHMGALKHSSRA